ncbi:MAG: hypothetical protein FRX49_06837 [Trebouxia sp. A1-2]|nr:MAG: hypothetical protein FRX49_06837 [Trebouxia sp. A1-2]
MVGRGSILTAAAPTMTVAVAANSPPNATRLAPTRACCVIESGGKEDDSASRDVDVLTPSWLIPDSCELPALSWLWEAAVALLLAGAELLVPEPSLLLLSEQVVSPW